MKPLSTKTVKVITTVLVIGAFALMAAGPKVVHRPKKMPVRRFANRLAIYSGALGICAVGALVGAYVVMRRVKEEYRESALENVKDLIESARLDRLRKAGQTADEEPDA